MFQTTGENGNKDGISKTQVKALKTKIQADAINKQGNRIMV